MLMSTQTLTEAGNLLSSNVLHDEIKIYAAAKPRTVDIHVVTDLELLATGIPALVQTTTLANAVESRVDSVYSVKVARGTVLDAGMVIEVVSCELEPDLIGKKLKLDKVSKNGAALIRKAVAADWETVNQEGKAEL